MTILTDLGFVKGRWYEVVWCEQWMIQEGLNIGNAVLFDRKCWNTKHKVCVEQLEKVIEELRGKIKQLKGSI